MQTHRFLQIGLLIILAHLCFQTAVLAKSVTEYHSSTFKAHISDDEMLLLDKIRQEFSLKSGHLPNKSKRLSTCAREEANRIINLGNSEMLSLGNKDIRSTLRKSGISDYQVHGSISQGKSIDEVIKNLVNWSKDIDQSQYNLIGTGIAKDENRFIAVVFLARRTVLLEPVPFFLDKPGNLSISGKTINGVKKITLHVTTPQGQVKQFRLERISYGSFTRMVKLSTPGEYNIEILTDEGQGPKVSSLMAVCVGNCQAYRPLPELDVPEDAPFSELKPAILRWVNSFRKAHKLKPIHPEKRLDELEQKTVEKLKQQSSLAHLDEQGIGPKERLKKARISVAAYAENLGRNKSLQNLLKQMTESPAHRQAILSPLLTHAGIGLDINNKVHTLGILFIKFPQNQVAIQHVIAHLPIEFWQSIRNARSKLGLKPLHHLGRLASDANKYLIKHCNNGLLDTEALRKAVQRKYLTSRRGLVKTVVVLEVADFSELASHSGFMQPNWTLSGIAIAETLDQNLVALILLGEGKPE